MHDRVGTEFPDAAVDRARVGHVDLRAPRRGQLGAARGEHLREVGADEAAGPAEPDPHASISATDTGRPSRSERQAASPITSGARASTGPTGGASPSATADTKASHSWT